jgi:hypothetical protein
MPVITTEHYDLSLLVYPSNGQQHCNGSTGGRGRRTILACTTIDSVTQWKENTLGKTQIMARMTPRTAMWLWLIFGGIFAASGLTAFLSAIGGAGLLQTLRFIVAGCFLMISAACFRNAWNASRDYRNPKQ